MFYLVDNGVIAQRWRSLPTNWRDPKTGSIHTRLTVNHPGVRVGAQMPVPEVTPPFERLVKAEPVYDDQEDAVHEGWAIETLPLDQARRTARDIVQTERMRRLAAGYLHDEGGPQEVVVELRHDDDYKALNELEKAADRLAAAGVEDPVIVYRGADDVQRAFTPAEWLMIVDAMRSNGQALAEWAWSLKDEIKSAEDVAGIIAILRAAELL